MNPFFVDSVASFSLTDHYYAMAKGVVKVSNLLFFASVIVVSLIITSIAIRARRS